VISTSIAQISILAALFSAVAAADMQDGNQALTLYQRMEYRSSLDVLSSTVRKDATVFCLMGRNYYMIGDYKKAIQALSKATTMEPRNAECTNWLGRAYGRQAETGSVLTAIGYATKARQMFEKSVALDPSSRTALGDLLTFYLRAPEMVGGGIKKAEELAQHLAGRDPAESHFAQAQIEEKRKDYYSAEQHLRLAQELDPANPRRSLDLAILLGKMGRLAESDSMFALAARSAPSWAEIPFERARAYIGEQRNLEQAKRLLQGYVRSPLTPDDPPREEAETLLNKINACCP
jgi:tetratricopeptide (TPR) repeat protein